MRVDPSVTPDCRRRAGDGAKRADHIRCWWARRAAASPTSTFGAGAFAHPTAVMTARSRLALKSIVLIAALTLGAAPSLGRDRPGTPNNQRASACGQARVEVCVEFDNTASEPVRFDTELKINDVGVGASGLPEIDCPSKRRICVGGPAVCGQQGARSIVFGCEAGRRLSQLRGRPGGGGAVGSVQTADNTVARGKTGTTYRADARGGGKEPALYVHPPQGFKLVGLSHDTNYCLRFRARRQSDEVVSEQWSNWACARTAAAVERPVPKPGPPVLVKATYVPGGQDWRTKPPTVVVTWRAAANATSYVVDKIVPSAGPKAVDGAPGAQPRKGDAQSGFQQVDVLSEAEVALVTNPGIIYRVCAANKTGSTCGQFSTFGIIDGVVTKRDGERGKVTTKPGDVLQTRTKPSDAMTTGPGGVLQTRRKPSDAMTAPLPPGPGGVQRPPLPRTPGSDATTR
jgi:hypothetical protein